MIKVILHQNENQGCWYIKEVWKNGVSDGNICYRSKEKAMEIAHVKYPYANIYVEN